MASSIISILIVVFLHVATWAIICIMSKYSKKEEGEEKLPLETDYFKNKFGTLTEGLRVKGGWIGVYWNSLVLIRWSITVLVLVVLRNYIQFQIICLLMLSIVF
jgi:hypothetical protein